jgi:hypothetical protein
MTNVDYGIELNTVKYNTGPAVFQMLTWKKWKAFGIYRFKRNV